MWLLQDEVAHAMREAIQAGLCPTAEQRAEFLDRAVTTALSYAETNGGLPRVMRVAGDVAEIRIEGTLTPKPDLFALLFGGGNTTYEEVIAALARAEADPVIKRIVLQVSSPGGLMDGLFDLLAAIEATTKPIRVVAAKAASAAYAIAAIAGPIEATNAAAEFGSIGVATRFTIDDETIEIASSQAPKKRPDPRTEEGKAVIREYLDAVHELFAAAIAKGRNTDVATVNEEFGNGATLLAGEAKRRRMIDKIAKPALRPVGDAGRARATSEGAAAEEQQMDLSTLKAQHPELYAAVIAEGKAAATAAATSPAPIATLPLITAPPRGAGQENTMDLKTLKAQHPEAYEAAVREGELKERDRVVAHLTMGEQCGDLKIAVGAIKAGEGMTLTLTSQYMCAGMNRTDRSARQADSSAAAAALDNAETPDPDASALGEAVVSRVEAAVRGGRGKKPDIGEAVASAVERAIGKAKAS